MKKGIIAIVTKDNKILMGKKKHKPGHFLSDAWHFPGGKAEEGESFEDALLREMNEELSVELKIVDKIIEYEYKFGELIGLSAIFHCTTDQEPKAGDDLVEVEFFDYGQILDLHDKNTFTSLPYKAKRFIYKFFHAENAVVDYRGNDFYCDMVINGRTDVIVEYETSEVFAFRHTNPHYPTHVVVIPKIHVDSLITLDDNLLLAELMSVVKKIAEKIMTEKGEARVITNLGNYQDSKHLHFHVVSGKPLK